MGGTCVKDTDLFQKEITKLLNAEVEPVYNLVKQLTKLIPVYFNEIGAEGRLRDVTTEIDELSRRRDPLIHFLRKQSHVESSNLIEDFIREIFRFWRLKDKRGLRPFLPPEVHESLAAQGGWIDEAHALIAKIFEEKGFSREEELLCLTDEDLERLLGEASPFPETEKKRARLARASLARLRDDRYAETFAGLVRELPQHPWAVARVNPADVDMAKTCFPGAEIVPDSTIIGGLEVSDREGKIRVVNTFETRLERSWPEIFPGLVRELEKDTETKHEDRQRNQI